MANMSNKEISLQSKGRREGYEAVPGKDRGDRSKHQSCLSTNSSWRAYVLFVKGNLGPGCLSLPYAFSLIGPTWSPFLMVLLGGLTVRNMLSLVRAKHKLQHHGIHTYGEVGLYALGKVGQMAVDFFLVIMQLSVCTVYFAFVSANLVNAVPSWELNQRTIIIVILPLICGLSLIKHMRSLAPLSLISNIALLIGMSILFWIMKGNWENDPPVHIAQFHARNLPLFCGNAVYAFEGIGLVLPIENSMDVPHHAVIVVVCAMATVGGLFILFGEYAVLSYGSVDNGSISAFVAERDPDNAGVAAQNLLICVAVILTYPVQFFPAIQVLEVGGGLAAGHDEIHAFQAKGTPPDEGFALQTTTNEGITRSAFTSTSPQISVSSGIVQHPRTHNHTRETTSSINIAVKDIHTNTHTNTHTTPPLGPRRRSSITELANLITVPVVEMFQPASVSPVYKASAHTPKWYRERVISSPPSRKFFKENSEERSAEESFPAPGDLLHSSGIHMNADTHMHVHTYTPKNESIGVHIDETNKPWIHTYEDNSTCIQPDVQHTQELQNEQPLPSPILSPGSITLRSNILRILLVCSTAIVAMLVPNVGLITGLAGSIGGCALNLVIPPLVELRLQERSSRMHKLACISTAGLGLLIGVMGTAQAMTAIFDTYAH